MKPAHKVLAAIDAGNTNITFGFFASGRMIRKTVLPAGKYSSSRVRRVFSDDPADEAVIVSVNPGLTRNLARDCQRITGQRPQVVGRDVTVPIKNLYRNPRKLGQDRLLAAWAGSKMYGAPLVVVDFGTAVTFDVVSRSGSYMGGMILPGLSLSLAALNENTALLPGCGLKGPKEFIGKDTLSGMLSGVVYGFAELTRGMVKKIKMKVGEDAQVIGTGGDIGLMNKYCRVFDTVEPDLILKGLSLIHKRGEHV